MRKQTRDSKAWEVEHQRLTPYFRRIFERVFVHSTDSWFLNGEPKYKGHHLYTFEHTAGTERMFVRMRSQNEKKFRHSFTLKTIVRGIREVSEFTHMMDGLFTQYLYVRIDDNGNVLEWYVVNLKDLRLWLSNPVNYKNIMATEFPNNDGSSSFVTIPIGALPAGVVTQYSQFFDEPYSSALVSITRNNREQRTQA